MIVRSKRPGRLKQGPRALAAPRALTAVAAPCFEVQGEGIRFLVSGFWFGVWDLEFMVYGLWFLVHGSVFMVYGSRI